MKLSATKMREIAQLTGLTYDQDGDDRLHAETISVDVSTMSKDEYTKMEKHLDSYNVDKNGYSISVWNDGGGYDYWKREGCNYIQITAYVENVNLINIDELKSEIEKATNIFTSYSDNN